jgi:predicted GH43/DUF377 family glycosyl hydrolase
MITVKIRNQFIIREKDLEYLEALPPNAPGAAYTKEEKKHIDAIYNRYLTKNNVVKSGGIDIYLSEKKRGWPNGEKMNTEAAKRVVLSVLIGLLKEPIVTPDRLAQIYRGALHLDEAHRLLIFHLYDFQ